MGHIQRITGLNTPEQLRAHLSKIGARLPVSRAVRVDGRANPNQPSDSKRGARGAPRKE
jgi:hypothetical protein